MKIANILIGLAISLILVSGFLFLVDRPVRAESASYDSGISRKLDDILNNQKSILEGIESIKEELQVIKMRVTR